MIRRLVLIGGLIAAGWSGAAADVLTDIAQRGTIRFGYRGDAPPFSYNSVMGEPVGLAVALCSEAALSIRDQLDLSKLDIEWVEVNARTRFDALLEGRTDIHCGPASAPSTK